MGAQIRDKILEMGSTFGRRKLAILEKELICCVFDWQSPDILRGLVIMQTAVLDKMYLATSSYFRSRKD